MLKPIFLIVIVLVTIQCLFAQQDPSERFEIDIHKQYTHCTTIALGEKGVFFYRKNSKPTKTDFIWKLTVLDTNLKVVNETDLAVNKHATLEEITNDEKYVYFIFKKGTKTLHVYRVNSSTLTTEFIQFEMDKGAYEIQCAFHEDKSFISLKTNISSYLLACDFKTKEVVKKEITFGNHNSNRVTIKNLKVDPLTEEVILNIEVNNELERALKVYYFDTNLKPLDLFDPGFFTNYFVHSIQVKAVGKDEYMYTGTYSLTKEDPTEGIFCIGIRDRETVLLEKFIPLTRLEAFNRYLNESGEETRELRKAQRNLMTTIHEVYEVNNHYFLVAEFYGPTYRSSVGATVLFGVVGAAVSVKFDGYLYKGADLVALDKEGLMSWDILLNLYPAVKPLKEKQLINVETATDNIQLNYPEGLKIKNIEFDEKGNILNQYTQPISSEEITKNLKPWYQGVYIHSDYFDKYIVYNAESITDKVTVKHNAFFIEKFSVISK